MIVEAAPAKINLALHVRARRPDGYHEIETLFAFLRDGDVLTLAPGALSLAIRGPFAGDLTVDDDNLVLRAAYQYAVAFQRPASGNFLLDKRLPIASGIGGGSADAAAALRALARRDGVPLDDGWLFDCAAALGSDVPACLLGVTAMGGGRGEVLEPLEGISGTPVLLVNPGIAVSTARVFAGWDGLDRGPMADGATMARAIAGRNDLEAPARALAPAIDDVIAALSDTNAQLARMSGSGATCFALYPSQEALASAAAAIRVAHPRWWCLESVLV